MNIKQIARKSITETKARIEHPEDRIFDSGSTGAISALQSLQAMTFKQGHVSIKFDGSPSLIAGRDAGGFTLTDKAGFSKLKQQLPRSGPVLAQEIFDRAPDQPGRSQYSTQLSHMFYEVKKIIPANFTGFIQFDVLWFATPTIENDNLIFQPNKVVYSVPVHSALGKTIMVSDMGIVIHSYFKSREQAEPQPVKNVHVLKLNANPKLAVLDTVMTLPQTMTSNTNFDALISQTQAKASFIDGFLNKDLLRTQQISDLPALMKSFVAKQSAAGLNIKSTVAKLFLHWVKTAPQITNAKRANIFAYITANQPGYIAVWDMVQQVTAVKNQILLQLDQAGSGNMSAQLDGAPGHEGFVHDSAHGKIKLVNRARFMRAKQP